MADFDPADSGAALATDTSSESGADNTFTGSVPNHIIGAQLQANDEGSPGLASNLLNTVGGFVSKGIPLTAASIANSFYNTAVEVGNAFGADAQKATIADEFGQDSEYDKYYQAHSGIIEGAGLALGSFIPGLAAVKVLKLAQGGVLGERVAAATGLFSRISDTALDAAKADALGNVSGTSLFGINSVNKGTAVLFGAADQALQGAVFQTATLATMKASPLLDDNTIGDNIHSVIDASLGFGILGGGIGGLGMLSQIKRANLAADFGSKGAEVSGALGKGNLLPGDRVVSLYEGLDKAATPTEGATELTPLQQAKLTFNSRVSNDQIHAELLKAAGGDVGVATAFKKFIDDGRAAGTLDASGVQDLTGQLSKLGRHGDIEVTSSPTDSFFFPTKVDASIVADAGPKELFHPNATSANNPTARAYQLVDPMVQPTIGRATDTLDIPGILATPQYKGAMDAYQQGKDIFIDAKGGIHINPSSSSLTEVPLPGQSRVMTAAERKMWITTGKLPDTSKELLSVGNTLNVKTGTIFGESPLPVVGDIAPPKLTASGNGLQVGEVTFPQKPGIDFSSVTEPMDANARYVWALQRGVREADSVASNDLPMLEQMYRQTISAEKGVKVSLPTEFSDTSAPIPSDAAGLLSHIAEQKRAMLPELITAGKNLDEIGHILNAPDKGISNLFSSNNAADIISDTAGHQDVNHIRLGYDIGTTRNNEGDLLRGAQMSAYRMQLATDARYSATQNYLSKTFGSVPGIDTKALFSRMQFTKGAEDADILGAGPGVFTNANAAYGTFAQQAERIGNSISQLKTIIRGRNADALSSSALALRADPAAAAEVGAFTAVRHSTSEKFILLPDDVAAANGLGKNTVVLEGAYKVDPKTGAGTFDKTYVPTGFVQGGTPGNSLQTYYNLSDKALAWEKANQTLRNNRNDLRSQFYASQGISKPGYNPDVLYAPTVNTVRQPYLAYVRMKEGYALGESGASVITARTAEDLQSKMSLLGPEYEAFTKDNIAQFKKLQEDYQYNRNFNNSKVDSELRNKGILNNIVPESRAENIISDALAHHNGLDVSMLQDHAELLNAPVVAQLSDMGYRFATTGTSTFGPVGQVANRFGFGKPNNPYQSYIDTMLNRGAKDQVPLWSAAQEKLEAFGNTAFNAVQKGFGALTKGLLSPQDASAIAEKFGLGTPYGTDAVEMAKKYYGGLANALPDSNILSKFTGTANSALGATVIRLDAVQQLIHAVTTPIMASMEYAGASKELQNLLSVTTPTGTSVPGFARVMYRAVRNYFGPDSEALQNTYRSVGLTRDELTLHRQLIDAATLPLGALSPAGWAQKIDNVATFGQKLVGTNFVNKFNHFIAADIGRQLAEASGLTGQEALDTIGTFVNRTLGNMAAGQRAGVFTGPVGQAIGLFQSYQMNMAQQLFRHIGDGNYQALAVGGAMQGSIFGLSSLPGFSAMNNLIAGQPGNTSHGDIYSGMNSMLGHKTADYLLYGSLSNVLGSALYSRGDLNPRRATILPTNPLEFPSVAAGIRTYDMLSQLGERITTGGSVPASLLLAAEHNGLSRPLTGLAQLVQGFSTDAKGNMISSLLSPQNDTGTGTGQQVAGYSDFASISNMSRLLGAKPLDEAIGIDTMYQSNAMKTLDRARLEKLAETAKTSLYAGSEETPEQVSQLLGEYSRAGGNQAHFNQWLMGNVKSANASIVNKTFGKLGDPKNQTAQLRMGGVPLPDYTNQTAGTQGTQE